MEKHFTKIVVISDTHNIHHKINIPECDILIHCGDYSFRGRNWEIEGFYSWLNEQPAKHKVSIQGNHELGWEKDPKFCEKLAKENCPDVILLDNKMVTVEGINIHGTPYTPYFHNWAYNTGRSIAEAGYYNKPFSKDVHKKISKKADIVVCHGPPLGTLDQLVFADGTPKGEFVGCGHLKDRIKIVKPKLVLFGHIHCGYGEEHKDEVSYYNASICGETYAADNEPVIINYEKE